MFDLLLDIPKYICLYLIALFIVVVVWIIVPAFLPVFIVSAFLPWLFLPLVFAEIYLIPFKKPILKTAILYMLAIGIVLLLPYTIPMQARPKLADDDKIIRIVSCNIREGENGLTNILQQIKALDPDIVCLQEVYYDRMMDARWGTKSQPRQVYDTLGMMGRFVGQFNYKEGIYGLMVVSRYPIYGAWPRELEGIKYMTMDVSVGHNRLHIINVHLMASSYRRAVRGVNYFTDKIQRMQQVQSGQIQKLIMEESSLTHDNNNVIMSGDFNIHPFMRNMYSLITSFFTDTHRARGWGIGATYPGSFPLVRLDYIFVAPSIDVVREYTIRSPYTDHAIVVAEVYIPGVKKPRLHRWRKPRYITDQHERELSTLTNESGTSNFINPENLPDMVFITNIVLSNDMISATNSINGVSNNLLQPQEIDIHTIDNNNQTNK